MLCNNAQIMIDWSDLRFVLETVRQGGLSGAARVLGVNHATVSRRISSAEAAAGALLFDRLPGGYRPTEAGLEAARAAETMEDASATLSLAIGSRDQTLKGPLSFTAPHLLIERMLAPLLPEFITQHPDIDLTILAANEALNLARREADVAIRISRSPAPTLHGSQVTEQRSAIYVSHEYAATLAANPHRPLDWIRFAHWTDVPYEVRTAWPDIREALTLDDMSAAVATVRAGIGATRMPCFLGDPDPELTRLPGLATFDYPGIWVLTHRDLRSVKRIETFMRFMSARLRRLRPVFTGEIAP